MSAETMSTLQPTAEVPLREREQAEVQAVLAALTRSPLMARLFSYVCQRYFEDSNEHLSEVKIAMEVFGRTADFDRNQDAIARVEAHRLRKKLKQYYEFEGKNHPIHIELPPGSYVPVFRRMLAEPAPLAESAVIVPEPASPALLGAPAQPLRKEPPQPRKRFPWWYPAAAVLVALVMFAISRTTNPRGRAGFPPSPNISRVVAPPVTTAAGESGAVRFLCGYQGRPHIGRLGEVWAADKYYNGGRPWPTRHGFIRRANDPFLFKNSRTGEFSYDVPARPGNYELHLYFVETDYGEELGGGENSRTMMIRLNGGTLIQTFDPLSDAGGPRIADERIFKDVQPAKDGKVHVSFESQRGEPILNALELVPMPSHRQLPIRLITQSNSYTDSYGHIWAPDNYYLGGQFFADKPPVGNTPDPMMFTSERAGNFTYAVPVDLNGRYTANLYFAETYFGPKASGVGGVGSRVFNVTCNGVLLLDHFDAFKEVGELHALEKSFHGLKPNAQGKLMLGFEPVANYASVFAIEVIDETR